MSIPHGTYDTLSWSQLSERNTPVFASPPRSDHLVFHFHGSGTVPPVPKRTTNRHDRRRRQPPPTRRNLYPHPRWGTLARPNRWDRDRRRLGQWREVVLQVGVPELIHRPHDPQQPQPVRIVQKPHQAQRQPVP